MVANVSGFKISSAIRVFRQVEVKEIKDEIHDTVFCLLCSLVPSLFWARASHPVVSCLASFMSLASSARIRESVTPKPMMLQLRKGAKTHHVKTMQ